MYGLKEKTIGKLLVQILKIDKNSEDGFNLLNWKLPGQRATVNAAGDFAGRCFEAISKRPLRTTVGDMTIDEVNDRLDKLSLAQKEGRPTPDTGRVLPTNECRGAHVVDSNYFETNENWCD